MILTPVSTIVLMSVGFAAAIIGLFILLIPPRLK